MRLATFNVMHGLSPRDGRVELGRFLDAVGSLDADVLALQEVDRHQPRSHRLDLAGEAAAALGATHRFVPTLFGTPGQSWHPASGQDGDADGDGDTPAYGIALLSRAPVRTWWVRWKPASPLPSPILLPGPAGRLRLTRDEPRVVLAARIDTASGPLTVATTHLSFVPGWNAAQLVRTTRQLTALPGPWVLAGDLNLPGPLPAVLTGWRRLARLGSYPAGRSQVQLDHVLGHGPVPAVRRAFTVDTPISDHLAVVVEFDTTLHRRGRSGPPGPPGPPGQAGAGG